MMSKQVILLLLTVLLLGLFSSAAPIPVEKKALKQLKLKRGDPQPFMKRDTSPKPSGYPVKRDEPGAPKPSNIYKRDEPNPPKPSEGYYRRA